MLFVTRTVFGCCLPFVIGCKPFAFLPLTVCWRLFAANCLPFTVQCPPMTVYRLLFVACRPLFDTNRRLLAARIVLYVSNCLLLNCKHCEHCMPPELPGVIPARFGSSELPGELRWSFSGSIRVGFYEFSLDLARH